MTTTRVWAILWLASCTPQAETKDDGQTDTGDPQRPSVDTGGVSTVPTQDTAPPPAPDLGSPTIAPAAPTSADDLALTLPDDWDALPDDQVAITWIIDGAEIDGDRVLPAAATTRDDVVAARATYTHVDGSTVVRTADEVTIANGPPAITSLVLTPDPVRTDDVLAASVQTTDPDGDVVTLELRWSVDGIFVASGPSLDGATAFDVGQTVGVQVTAVDTFGSEARQSASLTVANTPPSAPEAHLYPEQPRVPGQNLVCVVATPATDADGDAVTTSFVWFRDGVRHQGDTATTLAPGDTITPGVLVPGETWSCHVEAQDTRGGFSSTDAGDTDIRAQYFVDLSMGSGNLCALDLDGSLHCTGSSGAGELALADQPGPFQDVAITVGFACGLLTTGDVLCRSDARRFSPAPYPQPWPGPFVDLMVGLRTVVALDEDGHLHAWGQEDRLLADVPDGTYRLLDEHWGCAAPEGPGLTCWEQPFEWVDDADTATIEDVAVLGSLGACGILDDGSIACWHLDDADDAFAAAPAGNDWAEIVATEDFYCARALDDRTACWGLGAPVLDPGTAWTSMATTEHDVCGTTPSGLVTCGRRLNQRGTRDLEHTYTEARGVPGMGCGRDMTGAWRCWLPDASIDLQPAASDAIDVAVSHGNVCAVGASGELTCSGNDRYGVLPPPAGTFERIDIVGSAVCAISTSGMPVCWGDRGANLAPASGPTYVQASIAIGGSSRACFRTSLGQAVCTGYGFGLPDNHPPSHVTFTDVDVGGGAGCGVAADGDVQCWADTAGLGEPMRDVYLDVAVGRLHACALRHDRTLTCWARPDSRRAYSHDPPAGAYTAVWADEDWTCALGLDGRIRCWGVAR